MVASWTLSGMRSVGINAEALPLFRLFPGYITDVEGIAPIRPRKFT
jgi:hypothetical protein